MTSHTSRFLTRNGPDANNHLDVDAKESLKNALKAFKGTIILVSHEPEFYDGVCDIILNAEEWTTKLV